MIVDCVMASYEVDALRVRDAELADVVDLRVIVVGLQDFRGSPAAPLAYDPATVLTETRIVHLDLPNGGTWDREHFLRDQSFRQARDLVQDLKAWYIVADADEVPHPEAVLEAALSGAPTTLMTDYRQWYLDWRAPDEHRLHRQPVMGRGRDFLAASPSAARISHQWHRSRRVGWHLSNLGDAALASRKLSTFAHDEIDAAHNDLNVLAARKADRRDILDRYPLERTTDLPTCHHRFPDLLGA